MKHFLILALLSPVFFIGCDTKPKPQQKVKKIVTVVEVDADRAFKLIEEGEVKVLDVRTHKEFKTGHIQGATIVPIANPDFEQKIATLDFSKPYLIHCGSGARSRKAIDTLRKQKGVEKIFHLTNGLADWTAKNHPLKK